MHYGRGFELSSHDSTLTSPATVYPLGSLILDTRTLGTSSLKLAKLALNFLPRVDCMLMLDPAASYFMELGPPLGAH